MKLEDKLKSRYSYEPNTGKIYLDGEEKGWKNRSGYIYISTIFCKKILAHRLAWLLYYGSWPENDVDHINRDRSDNRIDNLRSLSRSQNLLNMDMPLLKGIYKDKKRGGWKVRVGRNGRVKRFKCFAKAYSYRKEQYIEHLGMRHRD